MPSEASRAPRRIDPVEALRLVRLARDCRHREPGACVCCPSRCRRDRRAVSTRDCIECLKGLPWCRLLLESDCQEELSHELITAASLMYVRHLRPGISFDTALALIAEYATDPARLEELSGRIAAFRLSCCFERLKRSGRFEDVFIDDPFDPEGAVSVKLTEAEWRSVNQVSNL